MSCTLDSPGIKCMLLFFSLSRYDDLGPARNTVICLLWTHGLPLSCHILLAPRSVDHPYPTHAFDRVIALDMLFGPIIDMLCRVLRNVCLSIVCGESSWLVGVAMNIDAASKVCPS